jgi:hypothetical protein
MSTSWVNVSIVQHWDYMGVNVFSKVAEIVLKEKLFSDHHGAVS